MVEACLARHNARRDDPASGSRQQRVRSAEAVAVGETAGRLHVAELCVRQSLRQLLYMSAQQRRQIGVGDRGLAPGEETDLARERVGTHDVLEADRARDLGEGEFVGGVEVGV